VKNKERRVVDLIKSLLIVGASSFSLTASAGSVIGVTITQLEIATQYNMVMVALTVLPTGSPSCVTNTTWSFALPLTTPVENQMLALLLSARATGTPVQLIGSGACDTYPGIETLQYVLY
jgi:hypothetical protein